MRKNKSKGNLLLGLIGFCVVLYLSLWLWVVGHRLTHEFCGWFPWGCVS